MHICLLTDYFFPHLLGGTEKVVFELGRQLVRKGCQVTVVTLNTDRVESHSQVEGMNIYRLPAISVTKLIGAQLTLSPLALFRLHRIVKRIRPDIIHAHNLYFQLTMVAPFMKRLAHVPLVTTIHLPQMVYNRILLDFSIRFYQTVVGNLIIRSSDKLVAVSQTVMRHVIEDLKPHPSKIVVIPNGVDTDVYMPNAQKGEDIIVTYVGRLIANKGPHYLVQAAPDILKDHPEVHFYIIGAGPLRNELLKRATFRKIVDHFHFFGSVHDVLPFLRATTVFVRPSLTEGMSLAVLEAMACGLPIVASNVLGNAEILEDGVDGYLVPPADSKALAKAISFLLANREVASALGKNARKTVERLYNWKTIAEKTLEVYTSLA